MQITLTSIQSITSNVSTFWFTKPNGFSFIAGQFAEVTLPHMSDTRGQSRWLTISSPPSHQRLSFTLRIPDKQSTFKNTLSRLRVGDSVKVSEPMGDFVLPRNEKTPLACIAIGIGLTPFMSMLGELEATKQKRQISILFYAQNEKDLTLLASLPKQHTSYVVLKNPSTTWAGIKSKSLSKDLIQQIVTINADTRVCISGPEILAQAIADDLQNDIKPSQIMTDFFPGYSSL